MCGINGFYLKKKEGSDSINLEKANQILKHRGPDFHNVYYDCEKKLGLGHTRLSIQDLNTVANQPMISNCKRFVIVFNGEIYNFKELKKKIQYNYKI